MKRIAFVSFGSFGDNCNSTLMLKPIKNTFQDYQIDVHTSTFYQSAFKNNPYIDNIITYGAGNKSEAFDLYNTVPNAGMRQIYEKIFIPAPILHPNRRNSLLHPEFGQNIITTFMRVLEDNNIPYEWPVKTILVLDQNEINNVDKWLENNKVKLDGHRNIIMEAGHESGQSYFNRDWTTAVSRYLMKKNNTNLFISRRDLTPEIAHMEREFSGKVRWVGNLSIRECAELYNRCEIFISVSSGLSNACCSSHCIKPDGIKRKWFETVNSPTVNSAPLGIEGKVFYYSNNLQGFLETLHNQGV